jgi:transposase
VWLRAAIVLAAADTCPLSEVAAGVGCCRNTVRKWVRRYQAAGIDGLCDLPRAGCPNIYGDDARTALIAFATSEPPTPFWRWTHNLLADALGDIGFYVSHDWVRTQLTDCALNVTSTEGWLHRTDSTTFTDRARDVCDLLCDGPGDGGVVICVDEKTQIQARERARPDTLPCPGHKRRRQFDYTRHGTVSLVCALKPDTGSCIWQPIERNDVNTFCSFLDRLDSMLPQGPVHVVLDNGASHTAKTTRAWLDVHPRFTFHHTPAHASWLNPVEQVFSVLQRQVLAGGNWTSTTHLAGAVTAWFELDPHKVRWRWRWPPDWSRTSA